MHLKEREILITVVIFFEKYISFRIKLLLSIKVTTSLK